MICPKCQSRNPEAIESWTISGRKMTIPLVRLWACMNQDCRHQWPRELRSSIHGGDLPEMQQSECQTRSELPDLPPQTRRTSHADVGL